MNVQNFSVFQSQKTICLRGKLVNLSKTQLIGILNVTPDSFYDGGKYQESDQILYQAERMLEEGASILDIGGYSSRPGADDISIDEELARVIPAIELIIKNFPEVYISIDTFRSKVAQEAVKAGACLINDISGGELDAQMFEMVRHLQVPYILMHMRGNPQNMRHQNDYEHIFVDILNYFAKKVYMLRNLGIKDIILDPGFGFAKNIAQNYTLLNHLNGFQGMHLPILVGISRKSMIYKTLQLEASEALNGTSVLNTLALLKNAAFLRVHDVKAAAEVVKLVETLHRYTQQTF